MTSFSNYLNFWNFKIVFNFSPLTCAVNKGNAEIVEELLKHKSIDVNIQDIND